MLFFYNFSTIQLGYLFCSGFNCAFYFGFRLAEFFYFATVCVHLLQLLMCPEILNTLKMIQFFFFQKSALLPAKGKLKKNTNWKCCMEFGISWQLIRIKKCTFHAHTTNIRIMIQTCRRLLVCVRAKR